MGRLLPVGSMILTPTDARVLYQVARIGELRGANRIGNTHVYDLLNDISRCAFNAPDAGGGILPRHDSASEEREYWTVPQLAKATGLSERKIRLDCEQGRLPATKPGTAWVITRDDATTYRQAHRAA